MMGHHFIIFAIILDSVETDNVVLYQMISGTSHISLVTGEKNTTVAAMPLVPIDSLGWALQSASGPTSSLALNQKNWLKE